VVGFGRLSVVVSVMMMLSSIASMAMAIILGT
jgi:hypothetical protein